MSEQTLFTREDAARIERQAQDLVGAWPTISVLPNQISVAAECISPYAQKISDRLILMLTAGLAALIGYLAWKTAFFDPYVALAYPYVAARAETATEAMVYAYAVPIVILMLFGTRRDRLHVLRPLRPHPDPARRLHARGDLRAAALQGLRSLSELDPHELRNAPP